MATFFTRKHLGACNKEIHAKVVLLGFQLLYLVELVSLDTPKSTIDIKILKRHQRHRNQDVVSGYASSAYPNFGNFFSIVLRSALLDNYVVFLPPVVLDIIFLSGCRITGL